MKKDPTMQSNPLVIYHGNCLDGFTSAWCAWHRFGDAADYVPAHYGDAPPDCTGRAVYIVDFSYPRATLEAIRAEAHSLVILDHHKTAQQDLRGFPGAVFDMDRSGARLACDYWREDQPNETQALVDYVQDRDLWRWALPNSRAISAWLSSHEMEFGLWDDLSFKLATAPGICADEGNAILRALEKHVKWQAALAGETDLAGHRVPCINCTYGTSELIGKLAESAAFAVGWFQRKDGAFVYSLRSRGDFDVSEVARQFGGGGHRNAAGFTTKEMVHK